MTSRLRSVPATAVAAAAVLTVAVGAVFLVGLGGAGSEDSGPPTKPPGRAGPSSPENARSEVRSSGLAPEVGPSVTLVEMSGALELLSHPPLGVGDLEDGNVLLVSISGFDWIARGVLRQCVTGSPRRCGNDLPVQFDEDGSATVEYLVTTDFAPAARSGGCRVGSPPCTIVVDALDSDDRAETLTVFDEPLPPPARTTVSPSSGLQEDGTLEIAVTGLPPGARVESEVCAADDSDEATRCTSLGPEARMTADGSGTARATVSAPAGRVGEDGPRCDRADLCTIVVVSDTAVVRATPAPIRFATPPGASYSPERVAFGLLAALALLLTAVWLIRRTDWSPIGEEAAPEIDDAEYADLDALAAAAPPEPDLDELVRGG